MGQPKWKLIGQLVALPLFISGCAPLPPVSISELTKPWKDFPPCRDDTPSCQVEKESAFNKARLASYEAYEKSSGLAPFVMRVDKVSGSGKLWTLTGMAAWDAAAEKESADRSARSGLALAMGLAILADGGSLMDGAKVGSSIITEAQYGKAGKCITSFFKENPPATLVKIEGLTTEFSDIKGLKEGAFVEIYLLPKGQINNFNQKSSAWDEASVFSYPDEGEFGSIELWSKNGYSGPYASGMVVSADKPTASCVSSK